MHYISAQHYRLTDQCWSVKPEGFQSRPDTKHYLWVDSLNCDAEDKRQYKKVPTSSIWTNIMYNFSMLFHTSWCGFITKINIVLVQVQIIKNAIFHILLKCRNPAICEWVSHCLPICIATLPVLSSENKILPYFAKLWNI